MSSKFKPVRVQASAIPAADVYGYWLPALVGIDPNIRPDPSCRAVVPELCARKESALRRAERIVAERYRTWKVRRDGWRVAPDGDTLLPNHDGASWYLHFPENHAAA
jgi:hypothetical protein